MSRRPTPPRVSHLLPPSLLAELLAATYAKANNRTADEVYDELKTGIEQSQVAARLCEAIWRGLQKAMPGKDEATVLDHLAAALAKKAGARAPAASRAQQERMNALFAVIDVPIGRASDATRQALESPAGQKLLGAAVDTAADFLVSRWK